MSHFFTAPSSFVLMCRPVLRTKTAWAAALFPGLLTPYDVASLDLWYYVGTSHRNDILLFHRTPSPGRPHVTLVMDEEYERKERT